MTKAEHIRHVFALRDDRHLTIRDLVDHAIEAGVFTDRDLHTRGYSSLAATCRRALSAIDAETQLPFAVRLPRHPVNGGKL